MPSFHVTLCFFSSAETTRIPKQSRPGNVGSAQCVVRSRPAAVGSSTSDSQGMRNYSEEEEERLPCLLPHSHIQRMSNCAVRRGYDTVKSHDCYVRNTHGTVLPTGDLRVLSVLANEC